MQPDRLKRIRESMLRWYDRAKRELPWRSTQDPYGIWVAEVMLQQTRVDTVIPYYRRFLERFPDVDHLARAPLEEVLETWAGIGYYGRARSLHSAAREVVERYGGELPRDPAALQRLPGIGRYTAGAIASIAFNQSTPILDGNAARVLSRLTAHQGNTARLWEAAAEIVPSDRPGDFNQALMDLGATVCIPRKPRCLACPLCSWCQARAHNEQNLLPIKTPRKPVPHYDLAVGVVWKGKRCLLVQRKAKGLLGGLWEFPGVKRTQGQALQSALREYLKTLGLRVRIVGTLACVDHAFTHMRITAHAFRCTCVSGKVKRGDHMQVRWILWSELDQYPLPKTMHKLRATVQKTDPA